MQESSSLERIGVSCFEGSGVEEVSIPDGVRELCEGCFRLCESLRRVNIVLIISEEIAPGPGQHRPIQFALLAQHYSDPYGYSIRPLSLK